VNPVRSAQLVASCADKQAAIERLRERWNRYLDQHSRAQVATAEKALCAKIVQLKVEAWLFRCKPKGVP
jgi:hypothetical protein